MYKKKANSDDKCYNYYKLDHFGQNCFLFNKRLNKTTQKSWKKESQKRNSWESC